MKIDGVPFEIPEDSPWFPLVDEKPAFLINAMVDGPLIPTPMDSFGEWPAQMQALCAAMAAMEWDTKVQITPTRDPKHADYQKKFVRCQNAYAAARERMKGEGS